MNSTNIKIIVHKAAICNCNNNNLRKGGMSKNVEHKCELNVNSRVRLGDERQHYLNMWVEFEVVANINLITHQSKISFLNSRNVATLARTQTEALAAKVACRPGTVPVL